MCFLFISEQTVFIELRLKLFFKYFIFLRSVAVFMWYFAYEPAVATFNGLITPELTFSSRDMQIFKSSISFIKAEPFHRCTRNSKEWNEVWSMNSKRNLARQSVSCSADSKRTTLKCFWNQPINSQIMHHKNPQYFVSFSINICVKIK